MKNFVFTMDDWQSCFRTMVSCKFAFTMAEILLSLTIIGVVAAITLPSLMGNINERTWNTQRKALHARMSQAIAMMPSLNGYGTYVADTKDAAGSVTSSGMDTAAEAFLTDGLSKVLKINNICDNEHIVDCGIVRSITTLADTTKDFGSAPTLLDLNAKFSYADNPLKDVNTKAAAFETQNGESIMLFYNPQCQPSLNETTWYTVQAKMCANFVYDLNGSKGPNTVGKDIGVITALYPVDSVVVAPVPLRTDAAESVEHVGASSTCTAQDSESRMPNKEELSSIFYNRDLFGMGTQLYWSSNILNVATNAHAWAIVMENGTIDAYDRNYGRPVRCIKR